MSKPKNPRQVTHQFRVTWEIDVWARTPERAALQARKHQRAHGSTATVFDVFDEQGEKTNVDLTELAQEGKCRL